MAPGTVKGAVRSVANLRQRANAVKGVLMSDRGVPVVLTATLYRASRKGTEAARELLDCPGAKRVKPPIGEEGVTDHA